jgi:hypothetical protein
MNYEKTQTKQLKKWLARISTVVVIVYVVVGMRYALYSPQRFDTYLWGVYHVHSSMSDGLESPREIALQARASGVSLVILTDHGNPNQASSNFHMTFDGVTIVGGSEASLPDGRLTFFGAQRRAPGLRVSSFPPEAIHDAQNWGAFPVLAYPDDPRYRWRYWSKDLKPGGIEILNLFSSLRGASWAEKFGLAIFYPFSHYYFLKTIVVPAESIAHWDDFLQRDKIWGFLASDAHGGFHITPWLSIKIPSYSDTFSFAGMGIDRRYESDPEAAIRSGDFFNCIRGAGEPEGFEFSASYGLKEFPSGSDVPTGSNLHVEVHANQAVRLILRKDGAAVRQIVGDHLDLESVGAGVYRVEVFLVRHPLLQSNVPWILSNPIFVGAVRDPLPPRTFTAIRAQLAERTDPDKR